MLRTITKELATAIVGGDTDEWETITTSITGQRRWETDKQSIIREIVSGKTYRIAFCGGSTECQESELFYGDTVDLREVEEKEVLVKQWVDL